MGSAESILENVDKNLGHKKNKMKIAREFFSQKDTLRKIWADLDVDRSKSISQYEMRLYCMTKCDIGENPWRFLGGMNEKSMRAAFRKTCDMFDIRDGMLVKRCLTTLLKNIWYFSTFQDMFLIADLNFDTKMDRIEFSYLCQTFGLSPDTKEYDRALELTKSEDRHGLGFYAFCEYGLYMIRGRRKRHARTGFYLDPDAAASYEEEEGEEEVEEEEEVEGEEEEGENVLGSALDEQ